MLGIGATWYGVGVSTIADEWRTDLLKWTLTHATPEAKCSANELRGLNAYLGLPSWMTLADSNNRKYRALLARHTICNGDENGAWALLQEADSTKWLIQQIALSRSFERGEQAAALSAPHICPPDAAWCLWCVGEMLASDVQGQAVDILNPTVVFNVNITNRVPLVAGRINPAGTDNYIEYPTISATGSEVTYRLTGSTLKNAGSCILPRMVFWGETGDYLGEIAPRYEVSDAFNIELAWHMPVQTSSVTPRVSFDDECLGQTQEIALCSAYLAFHP
ncbi:MAG: hypothetical protein BroJett021_29920 [Chloroflexota bacterium]|nr:MAG: hypothetical protein BroJett021_29920 [Chloroflexota bacterium]